MRVFISGASGFVGRNILKMLLERDYAVAALVRSPMNISSPRLEQFVGDLFDARLLDQAMANCDAAIHLVGIIDERPSKGITFDRMNFTATRYVVDTARWAGVKRFIHMSALGTRPEADAEYHRTKYQAERYVRAHAPDSTIFRPSMIHGVDGEFMQMVAGWAQKRKAPWLFMPYFGKGMFGLGEPSHLQPVYVADVARAFVDALTNNLSIDQTYDLVGPTVYTWNDFLKTSARIITGKNRRTMAIPAWYAKMLTRVVPRAMLPFNRDQVIMAVEENTGDAEPFVRDFGWTPGSFEANLEGYAQKLAASESDTGQGESELALIQLPAGTL